MVRGSGSVLALSLHEKALAIWIVDGLCSSERIPEHRRVISKWERKLKNDYGMVVSIRRVCQMVQ